MCPSRLVTPYDGPNPGRRGGWRIVVGPAAGTGPRLDRAAGIRTVCEDVPVGWEALGQWGDDVVRGEPLTGGAGVNEGRGVRVSGRRAVARLGQRSDADLAWETGLLRYLHRAGMPVPVPVPTADGRPFADGLVGMTYVE